MRILALSDTHIGAGYDHRRDALADQAAMLAQVVDLAVERGVSLILHGGDVFHRSKPSPAELHCFHDFCRSLKSAGIPLIAIHGNGNHEAAHNDRSALELFDGAFMRASRRPEVITEFAGVAVCTLPAASLAPLTATSDRASAQAQAANLLVRVARDLFDSAPDDLPRILLAHQMVSGASLPTGLPIEQIGSVVLPLEELEAIGYDAIVLGDIHKAQDLGWQAPAFYCGSPMCMDFGEAEVGHGCWILEPDASVAPPPEFVPLADRRFVTVDVDLTNEDSTGVCICGHIQTQHDKIDTDAIYGWVGECLHGDGCRCEGFRDSADLDETDAIAAAIAARFPLTGAVVRVRYRASEEQRRRVDHAALARLVDDAGAHRLYGGIQWTKTDETRTRAEALDESVGPLEAVAMWLAAQGMNGADGEGLKALTAEYLEAIR